LPSARDPALRKDFFLKKINTLPSARDPALGKEFSAFYFFNLFAECP
jgi:hypothetical protein